MLYGSIKIGEFEDGEFNNMLRFGGRGAISGGLFGLLNADPNNKLKGTLKGMGIGGLIGGGAGYGLDHFENERDHNNMLRSEENARQREADMEARNNKPPSETYLKLKQQLEESKNTPPMTKEELNNRFMQNLQKQLGR